ncbi:MAG: 3'(2'),5'-bisphosphate nucleotidase CysQ [Sphingobium sp.]
MADGDILDRILDVVGRAADHALELWADGVPQVRRWDKEPGQPVSDADLAVDRLLYEGLSGIVPDAGWLSEETADNGTRQGAERLWLIDPIDGTKDYLAGKTGWSVSVALVERGVPVIGVLAAPARGELWVAQAGKGARRNGETLRASGRPMLAGARVPAEVLPHEDIDLRMVPRPNSIALRMALVAADEADLVATIRWGNEWDVAAAALIAQEAGAQVSDALGEPLSFNRPDPVAFGILCCAPGIHAAAVERLAGRVRRILGPGRQVEGKAGGGKTV